MRVPAIALAALLLFGAASAAEAQNTKIGYIDSQAILAQAPGAQQAQQ
jgi:Skp family chaperone for outer membrane proteins